MAHDWSDELLTKLQQKFGTNKGKTLFKKYDKCFPKPYVDEVKIERAILDIAEMEELTADNPLQIEIYEVSDDSDCPIRIRLFQYNKPIPLSDILPMLENMDLRTFSERPYKINLDKINIWISDFSASYPHTKNPDIKSVKELFEDAFVYTRLGLNENDGFNRLVLGAGLSWFEISIIRSYAKYLQQTGFRFSQAYIERTVANHADITQKLVKLFLAMHDPQQKGRDKVVEKLEREINKALELVTSLDEDRILRRILMVIKATLRTNYFQTKNGKSKDYLSFKLYSKDVPELPLPLPLFEIFVYSPRFEGIHLRTAMVARGGIRWSDRREDFRTEVLGLMKAQKVKNSVIVPSGAKGGFVLKAVPPHATREVIQLEVVACYKSFISGLLDLTDNIKNGKVVRPHSTVCYDDPDTYLVVAADKGTATFSDIANGISKEYEFWLGDAFASGGSAGYDHKKMGITARGAWESIKRHFCELEIDLEKTPFTMVGIGDMSGDVFGNGAIYTKMIKLVAAFDHRHIFLDPNPNPQKTFDERVRMFKLPTSSWEDFNPKLISSGGGVFKRTLKSIPISSEVKKALDIQESALTPNELIRAILSAPVDLLFNGGIGTYVKASYETHAEVGDKANEFCRINGGDLRCRVVGEGGNLGFTQLGRVEYALEGGLISTDFIDNSAGVDCSDHEVNIKILLNKEMARGKLTEKNRNTFLAKMTEEVARLVLCDNYNQSLVLSVSAMHSTHYTSLYENFLKEMETTGVIDRAVEFLPDDKTIHERKALGIGFSRPELAVLLAYAKIHIKNEILKSDLPEDPFFNNVIETAFPSLLYKKYHSILPEHPLRREIIATQLSNQVVNSMGITFAYRLQTETGASIAEVVRAYTVASHVYQTFHFKRLIEALDFKISVKTQYDLLSYVRKLLNLATRWFLRSNRLHQDIGKIVTHYSAAVKKLEKTVINLMVGATKDYLASLTEQFVKAGLPRETALRIAVSRAMYTALNITEVATQHKFDLVKTAEVYFDVGRDFNLVWFRDQIASDNREGHWNTLARLSLRDELDALQRDLTIVIMKSGKKEVSSSKLITAWRAKHKCAIEHWEKVLHMLLGSTDIDYVMFFISLRELADLIEGSRG